MDAVRAAGEQAGLRTAFCCLQSEVVPRLLAAASHADPLVDLARRSQQSALSSHYVWGSHWWLLQTAEPAPTESDAASNLHAARRK